MTEERTSVSASVEFRRVTACSRIISSWCCRCSFNSITFCTRRFTVQASKGRRMISVAPESKARTSSSGASSLVMTMTGTVWSRPLDFISAIIWYPSFTGMTISSNTAAIRSQHWFSSINPCSPFCASSILKSLANKLRRIARLTSISSTIKRVLRFIVITHSFPGQHHAVKMPNLR